MPTKIVRVGNYISIVVIMMIAQHLLADSQAIRVKMSQNRTGLSTAATTSLGLSLFHERKERIQQNYSKLIMMQLYHYKTLNI